MHDDAALLRRYAESRSEEAFAELVRRHLNLVYFAALRSAGGNGPLAEDVAQEVFTALARQASGLARHATLVGWLYTTTRFTTAKVVRSERRRKSREGEAHVMMERARENEPAVDWERLRPVLDEALEELNGRDREAVLLRCLEGRAFAEIGATLRVSEDAARMRVERALEKLRGGLGRRGLTSTGAALGAAIAQQATAAVPVGLAGSIATTAVGAAAGVGGATGALGFIQLMTNTKLAVGVSGLLALGLMGWAVREVTARWEAETAWAAEQKGRATLARTRSQIEARALVVEQENGRLAKTLADRRAAAAEEAAARARAAEEKPVAKLSPQAEGKLFLTRHPEVKQALIEWASAKVLSRWGPFLKARGLTP